MRGNSFETGAGIPSRFDSIGYPDAGYGQNAELERLASTDYLTNLYNRRRFFHTAEREISDALQNECPISVTLLDLDFFEQVNDMHEHLVGDQVLMHVADLIRNYCREKDIAARYGGEEFAILYLDTDRRLAYEIVDEIRREVEATSFVNENNEIGMTFSAGVVDTQVCRDCPRVDDLLSVADRALYRTKDAVRNRVIIFDE